MHESDHLGLGTVSACEHPRSQDAQRHVREHAQRVIVSMNTPTKDAVRTRAPPHPLRSVAVSFDRMRRHNRRYLNRVHSEYHARTHSGSINVDTFQYADPGSTGQQSAAENRRTGRIYIGSLEGRSFLGASRSLLPRVRAEDYRILTVTQHATNHGEVRIGTLSPTGTASTETHTVPLGSLGAHIEQQDPGAVALLLTPEVLPSDPVNLYRKDPAPTLHQAVICWIAIGMDVGLVAPDQALRDRALVQFAELSPVLEAHTPDATPGARALITQALGDAGHEHTSVAEAALGDSVALALLFSQALRPWRSCASIPGEAVAEALAIAFARAAAALCSGEGDLAVATVLSCGVAAGAVIEAAPSIGVTPHRAATLRDALLDVGLGGTADDPTVAKRLGAGLRRLLPQPEYTAMIQRTGCLLHRSETDPRTILKVLTAVRSTSPDDLCGLIADTVHILPPSRQHETLLRLLPLLSDPGPDPIGEVAAAVSGHMAALRPVLIAAAEHSGRTDPLKHSSWLVSLEHPGPATCWAERTLRRVPVNDPLWTKAALVWQLAARSTHEPTSFADADGWLRTQENLLTPEHAQTVASIRVLITAFTADAEEEAVIRVAKLVDDLTLNGWDASMGDLIAAACLAVDQIESAHRWSWRVRAHSREDSVEHGAALLMKGLCEYLHDDLECAHQHACAAQDILIQNGALALASVAELATELTGEQPTPKRAPIPGNAHEALVAAHHYLAVVLALATEPDHPESPQKSAQRQAINVLFDVGRRLRDTGLDNPGLLGWRKLLAQLCEQAGEGEIADCLRADLTRAEERWRRRNPHSAQLRQERRREFPRTTRHAHDLTAILSASELRVVERVVAGDTNTEAATNLYLSKRTIDTHLRNIYRRLIYRRLGIRSREELKIMASNGRLNSKDEAREISKATAA